MRRSTLITLSRTALALRAPAPRLLSCTPRLFSLQHTRAPILSRPRPPPISVCRRYLCIHGGGATPEAAIARINKAFVEAKEGCADVFEPTLGDDGVLLLDLGPKGQYSLQASNGRLLLFSPLVGPKYYDYDPSNRWWYAPEDGHLLDELLVRELMHITSIYLNL